MAERAIALVMLIVGAVYLAQALRMPLGTAARPGPGFYPALVGVFACGVALVLVAMALRGAARAVAGERPDPATPSGRRQVALAVALLASFCLLLPAIGYPLAALLFVATLLRGLGTGWSGALIAGVVGAEASYYLFAILLGVTLPRGAWPH